MSLFLGSSSPVNLSASINEGLPLALPISQKENGLNYVWNPSSFEETEDEEVRKIYDRVTDFFSTPELSASALPLEMDPDILQRYDGEVWKCIGRLKASGGYFYYFRLRDEYSWESRNKEEFADLAMRIEQKQLTMYPTLEPCAFFSSAAKMRYGYIKDKEEAAQKITHFFIDKLHSIFMEHFSEQSSENISERISGFFAVLNKQVGETSNKIISDILHDVHSAEECLERFYSNLQHINRLSMDHYRNFFDDPSKLKDMQTAFNGMAQYFNKFGFCSHASKGILQFPDREELIGRWEQARINNPAYPPLSITSSDGIMGDMEFASFFLNSDLLLSEKKFITDLHIHMEGILDFIYTHGGEAYKKKQEYLHKVLGGVYEKIIAAREQKAVRGITDKELEMSEVLLRLATEVACNHNSSIWSFDKDGEIVEAQFDQNTMNFLPAEIWQFSNNRSYLKSRLGDDCTYDKLHQAWEKIYHGVTKDAEDEKVRLIYDEVTDLLSTPGLSASALPLERDRDILKQYDGKMWRCVGRLKVGKGYFYYFQRKEEYSWDSKKGEELADFAKRIEQKHSAIYPAIEPSTFPYNTSLISLSYVRNNEEAALISTHTTIERVHTIFKKCFSEKSSESISDRISSFFTDIENKENSKITTNLFLNIFHDVKSIEDCEKQFYSNLPRIAQCCMDLARKILDGTKKIKSYFSSLKTDNARFFNKLGFCYQISKGILQFPDQEELQGRWEEARISNPTYPPLSCTSSDGIVSDMQFVSSYLNFDLLLSKEEFVHDCNAHVISTLSFLIAHGGNGYNRKQRSLRTLLGDAYKQIITAKEQKLERGITDSELEMSEALLGLATDTAYSYTDERWSFDKDGKTVKAHIDQDTIDHLPDFIWSSISNRGYLKSRFSEDCTLETLQKAWKKVYTTGS